MSKSKRARSSKARSAPKIRSKAATRKSAAPHHAARTNSKQARVVELLRRPNDSISVSAALADCSTKGLTARASPDYIRSPPARAICRYPRPS
jgi:hypothetical protein